MLTLAEIFLTLLAVLVGLIALEGILGRQRNNFRGQTRQGLPRTPGPLQSFAPPRTCEFYESEF